jgi:hypothetical protein
LEINPNLDIFNNNNKKNKHILSKINNKSSNCITPGSFNPLINYKIKEKKISKNKTFRNDKNKDHFYHMNPIEIFTYKPLIKRVFNSKSFSQNKKIKKSGKKLFNLKNVESRENLKNINTSKKRCKYLSNTTNNFCMNNKNIYEYEAPVISCKDYKNWY